VSKTYYLAEFGATFSVPLSESGRHSLFAGATLGLGEVTQNKPSTSLFSTTIDLNVGYQYAVTQSVALSARYRAITYWGENGAFFGDVGLVHGPEIGVTARF